MNEMKWWKENGEFVYVDDFFDVLYGLDIYWSLDNDEPDKDEMCSVLKFRLWSDHHKPYIKRQT